MEWLFKIELKDQKVFEDIEKKKNIEFPDDLKQFIIDYNGASPRQRKIDINGRQRIYNNTLSFNENENEATTYNDFDGIIEGDYIPFAMDPFGNAYLYSLSNKKVAFYDHEEDDIEESDFSLHDLIENLH